MITQAAINKKAPEEVKLECYGLGRILILDGVNLNEKYPDANFDWGYTGDHCKNSAFAILDHYFKNKVSIEEQVMFTHALVANLKHRYTDKDCPVGEKPGMLNLNPVAVIKLRELLLYMLGFKTPAKPIEDFIQFISEPIMPIESLPVFNGKIQVEARDPSVVKAKPVIVQKEDGSVEFKGYRG